MEYISSKTILFLSNILVALMVMGTIISFIYGTVFSITIMCILTTVFSVENVIIRRLLSMGWMRFE